MKPAFTLVVLLPVLSILASQASAQCPEPPADAPAPRFETVPVEIQTATGSHRFEVEVAASSTQKARGLMYRPFMAPMAGMLFDYGRPRILAMWMKNTCIPLDMLFYGADGRIVRIVEQARPFSTEVLSSGVPARGVVELNGGTARALGIAPGDRVRHPLLTASP
jgi:uncharacterized membrane protein (UPF0127 family)